MGRRKAVPIGIFPILLFLILFLYIVTLIEKIFVWLASLSAIGWLAIGTIIIAITIVVHKIQMNKKLKEGLIKKRKAEEEATQRKLLLKRKGTLAELKKMPPLDFEFFICDLFVQMGYDAQVTKATGDGGKDIIVRKDDYCAIVECKRYDKTKVTRPKIQQFHSAVIDCNAEIGYFISTAEFTSQARNYALNKPVDLISGVQLVKLIEKVTENQCAFDNFSKVIKEIYKEL
ncbi:restriction endonuclease [Halobacillus halophilus]|uniref:restriction endonuclease n=1 Tax=Halobacillus halophilus TaxID=1570 RepID=UPI001CD30DA8|nr:restriction endonuclease [Halobacillus halophilus]MCA1012791.1 restriction endonuclease [Halobacillus halophilus]